MEAFGGGLMAAAPSGPSDPVSPVGCGHDRGDEKVSDLVAGQGDHVGIDFGFGGFADAGGGQERVGEHGEG